MTDKEFRAMLDWYMCSDPWPVQSGDKSTDEENHDTITAMMERESKARGFDGWVHAFHEMKRPS
jgi:hypothetical protein